jgi:mono/diheme cytochrome c family protein
MTMRTAAISLLSATALFAAGCGAVGHIPDSQVTAQNLSEGKTLFKNGQCASCHTLADAGTKGTIGPNLDDAFRYDKQQGFDLSTLRDVVRGQIAYATAKTGQIDPLTGGESPGMPDNIYRGQQAVDVAVYVAQCAANPHCGVTAAPASTTTTTSTG